MSYRWLWGSTKEEQSRRNTGCAGFTAEKRESPQAACVPLPDLSSMVLPRQPLLHQCSVFQVVPKIFCLFWKNPLFYFPLYFIFLLPSSHFNLCLGEKLCPNEQTWPVPLHWWARWPGSWTWTYLKLSVPFHLFMESMSVSQNVWLVLNKF